MRTIFAVPLALAASAALCAPAHAITLPEVLTQGLYGYVQAERVPDGGESEIVFDERLDPAPLGQFTLAVATEAALNSAATVVGQVGHGFARLDVIASGRHQERGFGRGLAYGAVAFSDTITLSAPGLAGTAGTALLGVFVDGGLSAATSALPATPVEAAAFGSATATFLVQGAGSEVRQIRVSSDPGSGLNPGETLDDGFLGVVVPFVYGQPFFFAFRLDVEGTALAEVDDPGWGTTASFVGDFGSTATWAGISDVRDGSGALVEAFEVSSISGTDYRNPIAVPEPGTALPVLAGLAALAHRRRR